MADKLAAVPNAPAQPDAARALAAAAAEGDALATTQLLRAVAPRMMRVVRAIMGAHGAEVDDVVQQSLIGFVQALPAFRGECEPSSYACRIAVRTAVAARKRARQHHARCIAPLDAAEAIELPVANEDVHAFRRKHLLRTLLEEVPEEQAEALALRSVLGWSLDEIAKASGSPLNTIRSRLRLAKEALRRKIEANPSLADELGVVP